MLQIVADDPEVAIARRARGAGARAVLLAAPRAEAEEVRQQLLRLCSQLRRARRPSAHCVVPPVIALCHAWAIGRRRCGFQPQLQFVLDKVSVERDGLVARDLSARGGVREFARAHHPCREAVAIKPIRVGVVCQRRVSSAQEWRVAEDAQRLEGDGVVQARDRARRPPAHGRLA